MLPAPAEPRPAVGSGPADVAAVDRPVRPADTSRQLSLFGAESVDASPADVAGLLAGPGRLHRMGGTARVSVRVDAAWRVHALIAELSARGLEASWRRAGADLDDAGAIRALNADGDPPPTDGTDQDLAGAEDANAAGPGGAGPRAAEPSGARRRAQPGHEPVRDSRADGDDEWTGEPVDIFPAEYSDDDPGGRVVGGHQPAPGDHQPAGEVRRAGGGGSAGDGRSAEPETKDSGDEPDGDGCGASHTGSGAGGVAVFEVRTAYSSLLAGLAQTWLDGTAKRAPRRFFLTGPRLRLWAVAAGSPHAAGYQLRWGPDDGPQVRAVVVEALTQAGLGGEPVQLEGGPSAYRITGRRGLARLAELVGERPPAVPRDRWPQGGRA
jgi:hypothetical protein